MNLPTFRLEGKTYRFARLTRFERDAYDYKSEEHYNIVQQKRWWGWKTVEEEHVPPFAWIAVATLGSTDWKSEMIARWKERIEDEEPNG